MTTCSSGAVTNQVSAWHQCADWWTAVTCTTPPVAPWPGNLTWYRPTPSTTTVVAAGQVANGITVAVGWLYPTQPLTSGTAAAAGVLTVIAAAAPSSTGRRNRAATFLSMPTPSNVPWQDR